MWALVTGILGLLCCSPVGIAAIILGNNAKQEIDQSRGAEQGRGMAQAGFILGIIAIAILVLQLIGMATGVIDTSFYVG